MCNGINTYHTSQVVHVSNTVSISQAKARFRILSNFPLGDSFVCVSSLQLLHVDPDACRFADIKDMPPKLQRSTTALELAWKLCQHQRHVAILTIILFQKEGLFSIYSHKYIHVFTDRSSIYMYIDFLNTLVHILFKVLNCIDTFTSFSLSFISLSFKS